MNPLLWLVFPFAVVLIVPAAVGVARLVRWLRLRHDWLKSVRTQRTVWEQEEIELLREPKNDNA
jgi:hypothetical protein